MKWFKESKVKHKMDDGELIYEYIALMSDQNVSYEDRRETVIDLMKEERPQVASKGEKAIFDWLSKKEKTIK